MASASTTTASSSPAAATTAGEHWTTPYRRRLGIGNSQVVPYNWSPPNPGQLKIILHVLGNNNNVRTIAAIALNSSMDLRGLTFAILNVETDVWMQFYALRAAANLAKSLGENGLDNNETIDVVYHSSLPLITSCLNERSQQCEHEAVLKRFIPEDLEVVDNCCLTVTGEDQIASGLMSMVPELGEFVQKMKRDAVIGAAGEHWAGKYRSSLGIGDSPVVVYNKDSPKNVFKVVFLAVADGDNSTWTTVGAIAVDSNLKLVGVTGGSMIFGSEMGMQLYALRAAGNLAKKVREKGVHDGRVVYQSGLVEGNDCHGQGESESEAVVPDDLGTVDTKFLNVVGINAKKVMNSVDKLASPALKALIEKMKKDAGVRRR